MKRLRKLWLFLVVTVELVKLYAEERRKKSEPFTTLTSEWPGDEDEDNDP